MFLQLATRDVSDACDLLRPVWDRGGGRDGYVSIEVTPDLAYDTEGTIAQAQRLHEWIDKPNLLVKIPATEPGLGAIEEMISRGRSINVTLTFSLHRHAQVAEAYLRGLERLVESGGDPSTVASVASFFVSRVDTEVDNRLDAIGGHDELLGRTAPSRTPSSPTSTTSRRSPATAGRPWRPRAPRRSAACGPRRRPRTRPTGTRSTSRSSSAATRSTPCPTRRSRTSRTTARSAA